MQSSARLASTPLFKEKTANETLCEYIDLIATSIKDITDIAESFEIRGLTASCIVLDHHRIKKLKAVTYWSTNFRRRNRQPTIAGIDQNYFYTKFDTVIGRHLIHVIQIKIVCLS